MNWSIWLSWFIVGIIFSISEVFIYNFIFQQKIQVKKSQLVSSIIINSTLNMFVAIIFTQYKMILSFILFVALFKYIFKKDTNSTMISTFLIILVFTISEVIYGITYVGIFNFDSELMRTCWYVIILTNIIIPIVALGIISYKPCRKAMNEICVWYKKKDKLNLIVIVCLTIITLLIFLERNMSNTATFADYIINSFIIVSIVIFIEYFFKEKTRNNKLMAEYDYLLEYVKTYEKVVIEKSKNQHEYKNQLILLKGMIDTSNKKPIDYINKMLNIEDCTTNYHWLEKLQYIPQGGLKGLIYFKIEKMLEDNINVFVDISSKLKENEIWNVCQDNDNLQDISRIIGVYLDNAIDAVKKTTKPSILIEATYEKDYIEIAFSNTFNENIELDKVDSEGYSTKGKGRGYGLSLVKDIISKSTILNQTREINGIYYVQKLYIKQK